MEVETSFGVPCLCEVIISLFWLLAVTPVYFDIFQGWKHRYDCVCIYVIAVSARQELFGVFVIDAPGHRLPRPSCGHGVQA